MRVRLLICTIIVVLAAINQANATPLKTGPQVTNIGVIMAAMTGPAMGLLWNDNFGPAMGAVAAIQKGVFPDDNQTLKCYTLCIMKAMRTFKNGRIDDGMMIKQLDLMMPADMAGPLKATATKCAGEPPAGDDCETTYQFVKCSYQTDPDHFFFP